MGVAFMSDASSEPPPSAFSETAPTQLPRWRALVALPAVRRGVGLLIIVVVFGLVLLALRGFAGDVSYDDVVDAALSLGPNRIGLAILFTALSFAALVFYDVVALAHVGARRPLYQVAFASFCAFAVGNTAGFGPLSAGAIRYRFYSRLKLLPEQIAGVIGFVTAAFAGGLLVCGMVALLIAQKTISHALGIEPIVLQVSAAAGLVALAASYAVLFRRGQAHPGGRFALPSPKIASSQLAVSVVDFVLSASVLYVLLPEGKPGLVGFVAVYVLAVASGILSNVPAGLGVFETVILGALPMKVPAEAVLSSLLAYRIIYHVLPLMAAAVLVAGVEGRRVAGLPAAKRTADAAARIAPLVISALTVVAGAMLVFSSVTPTPDPDIEFLSQTLEIPLALVEIAQFASGVLGVFMIAGARGIAQRLDGAWWFVVGTAIAAILLCFIKAVAVFEAGFLVVLVVSLLLSKRRFDRPASLFREALTGQWVFAIAIVIVAAGAVLFFAYDDVAYRHEIWIDFEFESNAPRSLRAFLGIAVSASAVALWSLLRTAKGAVLPPTGEELERAAAIVQTQNIADANLVRSGDKSILFSAAGDAFLMYGRRGRTWIAFLEPLGNRKSAAELIWRFVEMARANGARSVFYQSEPWILPLCADAGLQAIKLGESAVVDLVTFDLKGSRRAGLRGTFNRGERDGLVFDYVETENVPAIYPELECVSKDWLADKQAREKRFSVGWFDRDYMHAQPVAILRFEGRLVAFANVLVTATKAEGSIDLMRFSGDAPRVAMEYLLLKLMLHLKADGYETFNLGMAPFSGLVAGPAAPFWNRVGRMVFQHGERFYNFRGLRAFKSKFDPDWQPRYLAVSGGLSPAIALADASQLIAGDLKGVVTK